MDIYEWVRENRNIAAVLMFALYAVVRLIQAKYESYLLNEDYDPLDLSELDD